MDADKIKLRGISKWIAYFYPETLNFKLAQKCSFHALEVLSVAKNAKFQAMYSLPEGATIRWFGAQYGPYSIRVWWRNRFSIRSMKENPIFVQSGK